MSEVCGVIFTRGKAEPLPKPLCRWVERRIKMKREKADGSTFFPFISCVFYSKRCTLRALISFYRFRPRNVFFSFKFYSQSILRCTVSALAPLKYIFLRCNLHLHEVCVGGFAAVAASRSRSGRGCCLQRRQRCWERA